MDRDDWKKLTVLARELDPGAHRRTPEFSDADIVQTFLWAREHLRPVSWASRPGCWPFHDRKTRRPSASTMSRRLRTASVRMLLRAIEERLRPVINDPSVSVVDGKTLAVAQHSSDPEARFGFGTGTVQRGYKVHALCSLCGVVLAWRVTDLSADESLIAGRLIEDARIGNGILLADAGYHTSGLFMACTDRGVQLLAERQRSKQRSGLGHRVQVPSRLRSIELLEDPASPERQLYKQRRSIERVFARVAQRTGLGALPTFVRRLDRVRLWVQGAVILDAVQHAKLRASVA